MKILLTSQQFVGLKMRKEKEKISQIGFNREIDFIVLIDSVLFYSAY